MTADPLAPGPTRVASDRPLARPRAATAPPLVNPPGPDAVDRHGRRRAGGRPRHADAVGAAQGPPPAVRPADARLRPRRLGEHGRRRGGRPPPVVVYSPPVAAIVDAFAERADFALQDEPRGTGDAVRAALAAVPDDATEILVLSGDVPLVTGADLDAVLEARREDDAAIALASVFAADPGAARAGRPRRVRDGRADRRGEGRDARRARPATRSTPASTPSMPPGCAAGSARSTPSPATGELYLTDLVASPARTAGSSARSPSRTTAGSTASTTARSWPPPSGACGSGSTRRHMRAGVTMRDPSTVYLDWTVDLGADVTLEPNVILRGATTRRGRERHRRRQPAHRRDDRCAAPRSGRSIVESSTIEDEATRRAVQPPAAGQRRRPRRRGRQLRRAQEHAPRRRARSSTTSATSATPRSARASTSARAPITANYDGDAQAPDDDRRRRVHRRRHDARRAASTIGEGARTGAGAVVTRDVPPGKLAVGRPGADPRAARRNRADRGARRRARWTRSSSSSSSSS